MDKISLKEALPNTYQMAREAFFRRCKDDPKFRQEMIDGGVLVLEGEQDV